MPDNSIVAFHRDSLYTSRNMYTNVVNHLQVYET